MSNIRISVIIPIYNAERHLEECLDSCLKQALGQIEIICVNDGSTDNTEKILERYSAAYTNIIVLNQKNQGAGAARNLGMAHARGEFVAFMDSDDYYPDQYALKRLYEAAMEKEVLVCGGSLYVIDIDNGKVNINNRGHVFQENKVMHYREFQKFKGYTRFIYSTQFLKDNKINFPVYRRYEDPPFYVEVMVKVDKFYVIRDCVYMARNTDKVVSIDNSNILLGVLNGSIDILKISRESHLEKLHTDVVIELVERYISYIYKNIYNKNLEVRKCYEKVLEEIDETLLMQDNRNIKKPELISDNGISYIINQSLEREMSLLRRINSYKKALIYGAGHMGRILYDYIRKRGCAVDIDFMVSAERPNYTACGKRVKSIQECVEAKEDALVIIANKYYIEQMEENAHKYQFKNIEVITYQELMLFGADMMQGEALTIY